MTDNVEVEFATLETTGDNESAEPRKKKTWLFILIAVLVVGIIVTGIVLLAGAGNDTTAQVRDIFIILMALVSLVIGVALIVLIIQMAALINLLQNEIKPILKSTSDTVNTLKGTTTFLSDNLASPVIKINSSVAGLRKLLDLIGLFRK
jgi:NADH:ubiquinone oxidoreductase subunit K